MADNRDEMLARYVALFSGYELAYGRYQTQGKEANARGKIKGKAETVRFAPEIANYREHLEGGQWGLGLVPLRMDDTCLFGAIDIDVYTIDHKDLEKRCKELKIPGVICRTKSGGAHVYVFFKEGVEARDLRAKLEEWAASLGHGGCEIFPKQPNRASSLDVGNWINLPYQGVWSEAGSVRHAMRAGKPISFEEFLTLAESVRAEGLPTKSVRKIGKGEPGDFFYEGPPCLQHLHQMGGFGEGTRNDGMFNVAVYLRKRFPDDWRNRLNAYNAIMCHPPLDHREVQTVELSVSRRDYHYRCKQPPINSHCQRRACLGQMFGVGETGAGVNVEISELTKFVTDGNLDPATWVLEIAGHRVHLSTQELFSPDGVNRRAAEVCNVLPVTVSKARWTKMLQELMLKVDEQIIPEDAGPSGQTMEMVWQFAFQPAQAKAISEVIQGKPFRDGNYVLFRGHDLYEYLLMRRSVYGRTHADLWHLLKARGGEKTFRSVDGNGINLWRLPIPEGRDAKMVAAATETPAYDFTPKNDEQTEAF